MTELRPWAGCLQIILTQHTPGICQTSGESRRLSDIRQTLSAESVPAMPAGEP